MNGGRFLAAAPNSTSRVRLFCFPFAGGGASVFAPWVRELPPEVQICPVQLPGREIRLKEPAYTRVAPLLAALDRELRPALDRPFALFGHSLGALVAFELARYLRRQGGPLPQRLFVSARRAPQLADPEPPLGSLPDAELVASLRRRFDGIPAALLDNPDLLAVFLPTLRADCQLLDAYEYVSEAPLECPVAVFGGEQDRSVGRSELEGWATQTSQAFTVRMFPGDHFFLKGPARPLLLQAIRQDLLGA